MAIGNSDNGPYFVAQLDSLGRIQNHSADKIFEVPCNTEVRFQMSYSHEPICKEARLIVNKPKVK